jgi:hypothetical protein
VTLKEDEGIVSLDDQEAEAVDTTMKEAVE